MTIMKTQELITCHMYDIEWKVKLAFNHRRQNCQPSPYQKLYFTGAV